LAASGGALVVLGEVAGGDWAHPETANPETQAAPTRARIHAIRFIEEVLENLSCQN
jgi:hypothetical protein